MSSCNITIQAVLSFKTIFIHQGCGMNDNQKDNNYAKVNSFLLISLLCTLEKEELIEISKKYPKLEKIISLF
jgi:hypothetical protein